MSFHKTLEVFEKYKQFIIKNPLLASEIEVGLKWSSYLIAGRFSRSPVVTEFIHSASRLLNLVNDSILRKAAGIPVNVNVVVEKLQTYLTVIEYAEVFAEVAVQQVAGRRGKWLIVVILQCIKFTIRVLLLLKHEQGVQQFPPVAPLNRRTDIPELSDLREGVHGQTEPGCSNVEVIFKLKTSGRVMRTLDAAPPLVSRTWKLPMTEPSTSRITTTCTTKLANQSLAGELIHAARPLAHLACMRAFGERSWKPWMIALALDAASIHWLTQNKCLNRNEKIEINRRAISLIFYLLRSPFYDQYSKSRVMGLLQSMSESVPLIGFLINPVKEYIPEWQQLYFYNWSS